MSKKRVCPIADHAKIKSKKPMSKICPEVLEPVKCTADCLFCPYDISEIYEHIEEEKRNGETP